jgi:hypothetical protein
VLIKFSPVWVTLNRAPLNTSPVPEGAVYSFALSAEDVCTISVPFQNTLVFTTTSSTASVVSVSVNGTLLSESRIMRAGRQITLNLTGLTSPSIAMIVMKRNTSLTYSLLNGALPTGLSVTSSGLITGKVGNVPGSTVLTYNFTVRVTDGTNVEDREFSIDCLPVQTPTFFVLNSLPVPVNDIGLAITYYPLGSYKRAEPVGKTIEISDSDEVALPLEVRKTGLTGAFIEGLPPGVKLLGRTIYGMIDPNALPGRYLFALGFVGQTVNSIICEILVEDPLSANVERPTIITWVTAEGFLGEMVEATASLFSVLAVHAALPVTYTLAPGSLPLPAGLTLNGFTGAIFGQALHIDADTASWFTVRATAGDNHLDRNFAILVRSVYTDASILDIRYQLRTLDREAMVSRYQALVPVPNIYRPGDANFGVVTSPYIYLIKGLEPGDLQAAISGDGSRNIDGPDYHGRIDLILGPHKVAVARDVTGHVVYEVIYREIIDQQAGAGGFSFAQEEPLEEKVLWPESPPGNPIYIFPRSLRNARLDFIRALGFATTDPALKYLPGPSGVEAMPLWMRSQQVIGDPDSVPGFVPALPVAYMLPGTGSALLATLNNDPQLPNTGRLLSFDRYFLFAIRFSESTFFDTQTTTFDGLPYTASPIGWDVEQISEGAI